MFRRGRHFFSEYKRFAIALVVGFIGLGLDIAGATYPSLRTDAHVLLGGTALIMSVFMAWDMIQDLRDGHYGVDLLAITAIVTAVLLHEYWAAAITILMLTGGEALEDYASRRAQTELNALLDKAPKLAHLVKGNTTVDIAVDKIRVGDILIVRPGDVVPVDGTITADNSSFDESSLTGESIPVDKKVGDSVMSGSVNMEGSVTIKAARTSKDSQYEQIVQLVKTATGTEAPFVRLADKYAVPFTIISFTIAGVAWAVGGAGPIRFLQVLVVATPCPLLLGAPIALISGMSRSAKHGILIKSGAVLEKFALAKTIAFDKTGTLTVGHPEVDNIQTFNTATKEEVLQLAAGIESSSSHPLARAIIKEHEEKGLKALKAKGVKEAAGNGLSGHIGSHTIRLGKYSHMKAVGTEFPKDFSHTSIKSTSVFVSRDNQLLGIISFKDQLRPEAKNTIMRLRKIGIKHMMMLTGDNKSAAKNIADELSIDDVRADLLPADKLLAIRELKKSARPAIMVGDGVNDAPVLKAADVGVALGARGSTVASETADAVILVDDISRVATGIEIARRTMYIAKQSIFIGIGISVGLMFVFATGKFKPAVGAGVQEVVDVIVIINALRAHRETKRSKRAVAK